MAHKLNDKIKERAKERALATQVQGCFLALAFLFTSACSMLEESEPEVDMLSDFSEFDDSFDSDFEDFGDVGFDDFDFGDESFDDFAFDDPIADESELDDLAWDEFDSEGFSDDSFVSDASFSPPVDITAINFIPNEMGGTIEITTTDEAGFTARYNNDTKQYVIELQNANLKESLKRPFLMKDFETPFGAINSYQTPGATTARIVVQMRDAGEPFIQQEGSRLLVLPPSMPMTVADTSEPKPPPEEGRAAWKESYDYDRAQEEKALAAKTLEDFLVGPSRFYGRPISIQTSDADIRDVITFIAEEAGINLVLSEDVQGKISVKLRQVPWDQALIIVMRSRGLGYMREGNVIRITQLSALQAEANVAREIVEAQAKLAPFKVKVIPVSYADVGDLTTQVQAFLTPERGKVVSDLRTSSLIVTDTVETLSRVERLVKELDIPPTQVMIEGKVIEASEDFTRRLGVNWSFTGVPVELASGGGFQGSPITLDTTYSSTSLNQEQLLGANSALNLTVGTLDFLGNLTATLGLAQSESMVRIVSSPRVVTMNKAPAEITQSGEVITINQQSQIGGAGQANVITETAERTPVQLSLKVTPQITADGSVVMDVDVVRQFPGAAVGSLQARPINSREARTRVMVPSGQTAVIGGIYQSDDSNSEQGVPVLKDIPFLGWFFKSRFEEQRKNELIIFLTPRIINPQDQMVSGDILF